MEKSQLQMSAGDHYECMHVHEKNTGFVGIEKADY